jgi:hypothetical protein
MTQRSNDSALKSHRAQITPRSNDAPTFGGALGLRHFYPAFAFALVLARTRMPARNVALRLAFAFMNTQTLDSRVGRHSGIGCGFFRTAAPCNEQRRSS